MGVGMIVTKCIFVYLTHSEVNKPKHRLLEQRKVFCRTMQGDWIAHA